MRYNTAAECWRCDATVLMLLVRWCSGVACVACVAGVLAVDGAAGAAAPVFLASASLPALLNNAVAPICSSVCDADKRCRPRIPRTHFVLCQARKRACTEEGLFTVECGTGHFSPLPLPPLPPPVTGAWPAAVKQAKLRELRRQGRGQCKRRQRKGCRRRDEQGGEGAFHVGGGGGWCIFFDALFSILRISAPSLDNCTCNEFISPFFCSCAFLHCCSQGGGGGKGGDESCCGGGDGGTSGIAATSATAITARSAA